MKIEYEKLIDFYEYLDKNKNQEHFSNINIEISMLRTLQNIHLWSELSDEDKQKKRWEEVIWLKNKIFPNEYHLFIAYEESLVRFYDKACFFLSQINDNTFYDIDNLKMLSDQEVYLLRLMNLIYFEKESINKHPKIRSVGHLPKENIIFLFENLKQFPFYDEYKLEPLHLNYIEMMDLYNKNPYSPAGASVPLVSIIRRHLADR